MTKKPSKDTTFKHWKLSTDIDNVLWLSIDREGENTNSLSMEVLSELGTIVDKLEADAPAGLVLQSGKPGSFIVGADVREFDDYDDAEVASDGINQVHRLFNRIEALPFTKVAVIDGFCLGGGLELGGGEVRELLVLPAPVGAAVELHGAVREGWRAHGLKHLRRGRVCRWH